jgi:choline dehydrogenase-like flavoprotein
VYVNRGATDKNTFDAIVVGSGISGGWAAKELTEHGLKVLMLDRGQNVEHPNYPTATLDPWNFPHRMRLTQDDRRQQYIQQRHWSLREDNKHFYINDLDNPYTETKRFDWVRADALGGRSLLWSRHCYRWSDLDFEANAREGVGVDWPLRYKDLAPWYDYVETFIGVSGQAEGLPQLPDGKFLPAMEMNCAEKLFKEKIELQFADRKVTMGRVANLTTPKNNRGACQSRNLCHRGCPYGAYFCTNSSTLPAALATGNLTVQTRSLVNRILFDETRGKATGIEVLDLETNKTYEVYSRLLFLNAATLGTAFLLLHSTSSRFPNGLGNSSDQVGRNLMDHHKCMGLSATLGGLEDRYYSGRRPNGIYIPRFRNLRTKDSSFQRGYNFMGAAGRQDWQRGVMSNEIGKNLKQTVTAPGVWTIGFTGFGECLPYPENRVTLDKTTHDKWGRPTLKIDCEFKANERAMQKDMVVTIEEMLHAAGAKTLQLEARMSFPGNANHEMGTARMGRDPRTSVVNKFNQLHDAPNVFITDGSCMTSSSCVNPSLTFMALTVRACAYAIDELKKRNL